MHDKLMCTHTHTHTMAIVIPSMNKSCFSWFFHVTTFVPIRSIRMDRLNIPLGSMFLTFSLRFKKWGPNMDLDLTKKKPFTIENWIPRL